MHPNPPIRRTHSPEFKARVLAACCQPGASIAAVAQAHGVNANVVHKWLAGIGMKRCAQHLPAAAPSPEAPAGSGGIDTAALRRVWPDVLARIFTMRRVTWTFLSQHAHVQEYDGTKLVLGIATVGLTNTFRAGNHAELVRQALIDEIGVDVPVEGRPMTAQDVNQLPYLIGNVCSLSLLGGKSDTPER